MDDVLKCPSCGHVFSRSEGAHDAYAPPVGPIPTEAEEPAIRQPSPYSG